MGKTCDTCERTYAAHRTRCPYCHRDPGFTPDEIDLSPEPGFTLQDDEPCSHCIPDYVEDDISFEPEPTPPQAEASPKPCPSHILGVATAVPRQMKLAHPSPLFDLGELIKTPHSAGCVDEITITAKGVKYHLDTMSEGCSVYEHEMESCSWADYAMARVKQVSNEKHNELKALQLEYGLYVDVLLAIAEGMGGDPKELATRALVASGVEYDRFDNTYINRY